MQKKQNNRFHSKRPSQKPYGSKRHFEGKSRGFSQGPRQPDFRPAMPRSGIDEMRQALMRKTRLQVTEQLSVKEVPLIKAVNVIEDLDHIFNLLAEQTIDWHSYGFPELKRILRDNEEYLNFVARAGKRSELSIEKLAGAIKNPQKAQEIIERAQNSIGSEFGEQETSELKALALTALNVKNERVFLGKFLEEHMQKEFPNASAFVGEMLCAKLLARAGSIRQLAFMPSSRLQVIGAEKALFAHIKTGADPPKHGIIFQHPLLSTAKKSQRGKIARMIASKLSVCLKVDYFKGEFVGEKLRKQVEQKVQKLSFAPQRKITSHTFPGKKPQKGL